MRLDGNRSGVRTQSSLGTDFVRNIGASKNIDRISMGKVTQVNYRYNTVEVEIPSNGIQTGTTERAHGKYSARLPVQFSGTTKDGKAFGQVNPVEMGTSVLVGFIEGDKANPIVIGIYGKENESYNLARTSLAGSDPRNEDIKQETQHQYTLYPSLTYKDIDGKGNINASFTGNSFFTMDSDSSPMGTGVFDDGDGFTYEGLNSSYYYTGELIEPKEGKAPVILFKHSGDVISPYTGEVEESTHNFMLFLDQDGTYRLSTLDTDDTWRGVFEMTKDGKIGMRHQKDTKKLIGSKDYNEISVDEDGLYFRVGDKWSKVTPHGTYGTLNFGFGGGGSGGGVISDDGDFQFPTDPSTSDALNRVREKIEAYMNLADRNVRHMETYMERTAAYITQGATMIEEFEDELGLYESNLTQTAEAVVSEVASLKVPKILNDEIQGYIDEAKDASEQANNALTTIQGLVEDNILSSLDKEIIATIWEGIKAERPGLLKQAEDTGTETTLYEQRYNELANYLTPFLASMDTTEEINGEEFTIKFRNYYVERTNLIQKIYESISADILKALNRSADAAEVANTAVGSSGSALMRALTVSETVRKLAEDGVIDSTEKNRLLNQWNMIEAEYPEVLREIRMFNDVEDTSVEVPEGQERPKRNVQISTTDYENAYSALENYLFTTTNMFTNMKESTDVNTDQIVNLFSDYFTTLSDLLNRYSMANVELLRQYDGDFKRLRTQIIETDSYISLVAEDVEATGELVDVNSAELKVQATQISQRVTSTSFTREIDKNRHTLNATGRNLYSRNTAVEGVVLDPFTGEVKALAEGETSLPISVKGGYLYTISSFNNETPNTVIVTVYDSQGNLIDTFNKSLNAGEKEFIPTSSNASFVRISVNDAKNGNIQFEQGHGTGYFMYSNEDLLANVETATKEAQQREILWKDIRTKKDSFASRNTQDLKQVETIVSDDKIVAEEKATLQNILKDLENRHSTALEDAKAVGVGTSLIVGDYTSLTTYVGNLLDGTPPINVALNKEVITDLFKDYFKRLDDLYTDLESKYKISYDSSVEVLDEVLAGHLEAERIARDFAQKAADAAQSVSTLRYERDHGKIQMEKHMEIVKAISKDGKFDKREKISIKPTQDYIDEDYKWLIAQSNMLGVVNDDITNAFNSLDSYLSELMSGTQRNVDSAISEKEFNSKFQDFFTTKDTLLGVMIEEASRVADTSEEQAQLAREEVFRRDLRLKEIENILKDSNIAIERIEKTIEEIQQSHAYTIEVLSTNGFTFRNRVIDTTLEVTVYQDTKDITAEIKPEDFVWSKVDSRGNEDTNWNNNHKGVGNKLSLDHTDITGKATFTVEVYKEVQNG